MHFALPLVVIGLAIMGAATSQARWRHLVFATSLATAAMAFASYLD